VAALANNGWLAYRLALRFLVPQTMTAWTRVSTLGYATVDDEISSRPDSQDVKKPADLAARRFFGSGVVYNTSLA
jgi:hypothetical protein